MGRRVSLCFRRSIRKQELADQQEPLRFRDRGLAPLARAVALKSCCSGRVERFRSTQSLNGTIGDVLIEVALFPGGAFRVLLTSTRNFNGADYSCRPSDRDGQLRVANDPIWLHRCSNYYPTLSLHTV